jgi:hypothetical protein
MTSSGIRRPELFLQIVDKKEVKGRQSIDAL